MSIIEVKNLSYNYNDGTDDSVLALKDVSFSIEEGEFVAILGHNGSGKSTLAKMLNGLILPTSGSVTAFGIPVSDNADDLFEVRKNIGMVFQNPDNQMVASIIEDDVAFAPENIGLPREEIAGRIDWALKCVNMEEYRKSTPFRLSGGQKQRVAIAGVLAVKPKVLVFDESTSMLDPQGRREILNVMLDLKEKEGITIVLITHYMEEAVKADRIIVLQNGGIVYNGNKSLYKEYDKITSWGLDLPVPAYVAYTLEKDGFTDCGGLTLESDDLVKKLCR